MALTPSSIVIAVKFTSVQFSSIQYQFNSMQYNKAIINNLFSNIHLRSIHLTRNEHWDLQDLMGWGGLGSTGPSSQRAVGSWEDPASRPLSSLPLQTWKVEIETNSAFNSMKYRCSHVVIMSELKSQDRCFECCFEKLYSKASRSTQVSNLIGTGKLWENSKNVQGVILRWSIIKSRQGSSYFSRSLVFYHWNLTKGWWRSKNNEHSLYLTEGIAKIWLPSPINIDVLTKDLFAISRYQSSFVFLVDTFEEQKTNVCRQLSSCLYPFLLKVG